MDKRIEASKLNVIKLKQLLKDVVGKPLDYLGDEGIVAALKSQGALAKYTSDVRGIEASSLNTLKRTCERLFDTGFEELDALRQQALAKIEALLNEKPKLSVKDSLQERCQQLERELLRQKQIDLLMTHELLNCVSILKSIAGAKDAALMKTLAEKQIKKIATYAISFNEFGRFSNEAPEKGASIVSLISTTALKERADE